MPVCVVPGSIARGYDDEERHPDRLLVHEPLVEPAVVAEEEALVRAVEEHRVVEVAAVAQPPHEPADVVVDRGHAGEVVLHVALVLPQRLVLARKPLRDRLFQVHLGEVVGDAHGRATGRVGAGGEVVGEGVRDRDLAVGIQAGMPVVRFPGTVRGLVPDQEAPRIAAVERAEPADGEVGDEVGGVAGFDPEPVGGQEPGVVVLALVDERVPVVEPLRVVGDPVGLAVAHVPLADESGPVAGVPQRRDEGRLAGVDRGVEGADPVDVAVGAGQQGRPARCAERVGREEVLEPDPGLADRVDVGRGVDHRPVGADGVGRVVVAEEEQDVGPARAGWRSGHRRRLRSSM